MNLINLWLNCKVFCNWAALAPSGALLIYIVCSLLIYVFHFFSLKNVPVRDIHIIMILLLQNNNYEGEKLNNIVQNFTSSVLLIEKPYQYCSCKSLKIDIDEKFCSYETNAILKFPLALSSSYVLKHSVDNCHSIFFGNYIYSSTKIIA